MKDENKRARWILTQAANTAARNDDRSRKFYLRIAKIHGHYVAAVTNVANKLVDKIKKLYNERKHNI